MSTTRPRSSVLACLLAMSFGAAGWAAEPTGEKLQVQTLGSSVTVRVTQTTDLRTVLKELCQGTHARCELAPELSEARIAPLTIQGTWVDVVSKLLEGAKINYVAINPSLGRAGRLLIEARSPAGNITGEERAVSGSVRPARDELGTAAASRRTSLSDEEIRELRSRQAPPSGTAPPPLPPLSEQLTGVGSARASTLTGQKADEAQPSPEELRNSEAAIRNMYLGPSGSLPTPPPGFALLPYPDENGNPILIPITNQPITVLPYPDAHGRPILVPPGTPGLKLQNPFPSTGGSSKKE